MLCVSGDIEFLQAGLLMFKSNWQIPSTGEVFNFQPSHICGTGHWAYGEILHCVWCILKHV
jgi:hypothetical protein